MEKERELQHKTPITVIGGGSWATAMIKILTENEVHIKWWLRSREDIEHIKRYGHNPRYLSAVQLQPDKVTPYADLREALKDTKYVLLAVPSAFIPDVVSKLREKDLQGKRIVSAVKGLIAREHQSITEFMESEFNLPRKHMLVIAGPCHAEEVAQGRQSYLTISGDKLTEAEHFARLIRGRFVKASVIEDLQGVQYCAAMKNIIAVACGIARGLNYGDNFQAVLVSNALQETKRFLDQVFPHEGRDLDSSAYLGDLLVTAYSQFSRNRTFGNMIGRGYTVKSAQVEMNMVAEGYYAVKSVFKVSKRHRVKMPIIKAVYNILYERISPAIEMRLLKDLMR